MLSVDLHVHTLASGHAFNTLYELVDVAVAQRMQAIAITDHGPGAEGAPTPAYFHVLCSRVPKTLNGVRIIKGIEANIVDADGTLDLPAGVNFELVLAAIHPITVYDDLGKEGNTRAILRAMERYPQLNILAHPINNWYEVDEVEIAKQAAKFGVALEVNNSMLAKLAYRFEKMKTMLEVLFENGGKIALCSDAHVATELGDDGNIKIFLDDFPVLDEFILNRNLENTLSFLSLT